MPTNNYAVPTFETFIFESDQRLKVQDVNPILPNGQRAVILTVISAQFDYATAVALIKEHAADMMQLVDEHSNDYFIVYDILKDGERKGILRKIFNGNKKIWTVRFELVKAVDSNGTITYSGFNSSDFNNFVPIEKISSIKAPSSSNTTIGQLQDGIQKSQQQINTEMDQINSDPNASAKIEKKAAYSAGDDSNNSNTTSQSSNKQTEQSAGPKTFSVSDDESLVTFLNSIVGMSKTSKSRAVRVLQTFVALANDNSKQILDKTSKSRLNPKMYDGIYGNGTAKSIQLALNQSEPVTNISPEDVEALNKLAQNLNLQDSTVAGMISTFNRKNLNSPTSQSNDNSQSQASTNKNYTSSTSSNSNQNQRIIKLENGVTILL